MKGSYMNTYFLGIDGGGTKTEAVCCDIKGDILFHDKAGASNPNDIGTDNSVDIISDLINGAIDKCSISVSDAFYVFGGISGALNRTEEMNGMLSERFPEISVRIESDITNVMTGEIGSADGACVICGTGSVCFVRSQSRFYRIGGWGYLIDSAGSGFDIGKAAIEAVLRAYDGRGEHTILEKLTTEKLGKPVWDSISEFYDGGKSFIASFAETVFRGFERKDKICGEILDRNAAYIGECLNTAGKILGNKCKVVFSGGINTNYSDIWLNKVLSFCDYEIDAAVAKTPPVYGALCEAFSDAGHRMSPDTVRKLKSDLTYGLSEC